MDAITLTPEDIARITTALRSITDNASYIAHWASLDQTERMALDAIRVEAKGLLTSLTT